MLGIIFCFLLKVISRLLQAAGTAWWYHAPPKKRSPDAWLFKVTGRKTPGKPSLYMCWKWWVTSTSPWDSALCLFVAAVFQGRNISAFSAGERQTWSIAGTNGIPSWTLQLCCTPAAHWPKLCASWMCLIAGCVIDSFWTVAASLTSLLLLKRGGCVFYCCKMCWLLHHWTSFLILFYVYLEEKVNPSLI